MTRDQELVIRTASLAGYAIAVPLLLPVFGAALIDALIKASGEASSPRDAAAPRVGRRYQAYAQVK